jgi:hypothetical protein
MFRFYVIIAVVMRSSVFYLRLSAEYTVLYLPEMTFNRLYGVISPKNDFQQTAWCYIHPKNDFRDTTRCYIPQKNDFQQTAWCYIPQKMTFNKLHCVISPQKITFKQTIRCYIRNDRTLFDYYVCSSFSSLKQTL